MSFIGDKQSIAYLDAYTKAQTDELLDPESLNSPLGTASTKDVATEAEAIAGTPGVVPDAANVQAMIDAALSADAPYVGTPVGQSIALEVEGAPLPPTNNPKYRYVKLTEGENGAGQYNEGVLINETVTGSGPLRWVTAEINHPTSPLHGKIITLRNSCGAFLRAGEVAGVQELDAFQGHTWTTNATQNSKNDSQSGTSNRASSPAAGTISGPFNDGTNGDPRTANETRPKNVSAIYLLRIA